MTKSLIVHFSQGGTTAQVAESIAAGLRGAGFQTELCNLKDARPPDPVGYDLLGVGVPAYFFRPPFRLTEYLSSLPDLAGKPVFVFVLYGTQRGDAGSAVRRALAGKGGREIGYLGARGADFFLGYLKQGYLFSADHPTADELGAAENFGRALVRRAAGEEYRRPDADRPLAALYRLERFLTSRWLVRHVYSRLFHVRAKKCTACGLCRKICPTENITADRAGRPAWGRNCLLCVYCEMKCPSEAIVSVISWPIFHPFVACNVRRAIRDASLDHARVCHAGGRTRRMD
jgi:flavodoxin/ferredoxin